MREGLSNRGCRDWHGRSFSEGAAEPYFCIATVSEI